MEYEHGAENQPMDGNPSMRGPSESATQIARADCPTCRIQIKEQRDAAAATTTTASSGTTPRVQSLKLHVSNYVGKVGEPLLRWLVEVDTVIAARHIFDDPSKVAFAMSCLGGRARSWVYGRRLTDATFFGTYAEFKEELRQAFEPHKNEFRSRAEFLDLQQGKHDVTLHATVVRSAADDQQS
ncbi:hypothetical protein PC129_g22648 [Phytophthora cactorum]|uniref:Retrotransposon gag domain-containing protein n=1 Tax=Phytophthora cactorum TaxID=29920 RepID=A0A8T1H295_9STRA|nr:hypothetical protein PC129_g22648 [Phytophthora cactorum]